MRETYDDEGYYEALYYGKSTEGYKESGLNPKLREELIKKKIRTNTLVLVKLEEQDEKIRKALMNYFGAIPIGSQRLNLHHNMINDIDFVVDEINKYGLMEYLKDKGYLVENKKEGLIGKKVILRKEGCKPIDIIFKRKLDDFKVYTNAEIINTKYKRRTNSDLMQIEQDCKFLLNHKK